MSLKQSAILLVLAVMVGLAGHFMFGGSGRKAGTEAQNGPEGAPLVEIALPAALSTEAQAGQQLYDSKCVSCHGRNAVGQREVAPPLVHVVYEPNHHGDESFQRAVALGVRAHHWPFGNMPRVEGLSREDVALIVAYIRELQHANGIE